MPENYEIAVFEGDGIGPEIMAPTVAILEAVAAQTNAYSLDFESLPAGAAHYARTGVSLPEKALDRARSADAILLSAMGLPDVRYPDGTEISPQIELRRKLDLFAGVRPVTILPGQKTPLALGDGHRVDFVLVRESTEGLFHSQGQGVVTADEARETLLITRSTCEKLFRFAFGLARDRRDKGRGQGKVTCVDKANVFRAFAFFRGLFDEEAQKHGDLVADHCYVDAAALRMVQNPWDFDVLVTENMFGDILSDLGAGLMGGLGVAPSADIGEQNALFQPCHGSAPDIVGKGIANPSAMLLSAAMMLDWLGTRDGNERLQSDGARLRKAIERVIATGGPMTPDQGGTATTDEVADAIGKTLEAA